MRDAPSDSLEGLSLRTATPEDGPFLYQLKQATLKDYVAETWGRWDEAWQRSYFNQHFIPSAIRIVLLRGTPVGMVSIEDDPDQLFLAAIEILPGYQNLGIGTYLIRQLLADADRRGVPVRLQVLKVNPARRLYERLGFRLIRQTPTHGIMERAG